MQLLPQLFSTIPTLTNKGAGHPNPILPTAIPGLFQAQLNAKLAKIVAPLGSPKLGTIVPSVGSSTPSDPLEAKLAAQIAAGLKQGKSVGDIIAELSHSLATSVQSGGVGSDALARGKLQKIFAAALSPPGTAPPSADANGALALAHRFRQLAAIATQIAAPPTQTGQPNRFLGPDLDAQAKVDLAPAENKQTSETQASGSVAISVDSIVLAAAVALGASPAPSVSPAPVATADVSTTTPIATSNSRPDATNQTVVVRGTISAAGFAPTQPISDGKYVLPAASGGPVATEPVLPETLAATSRFSADPTFTSSAQASTLAAPLAALFANDGLTVKSGGPKTGSNGDTALGRILTRAINVAPTNGSASAAVAQQSGGSSAQTGGDLNSFLNEFAAAVAKADSSQASAPAPLGSANDFLATLTAANATNAATSLPSAPIASPTFGITSTGAPAPLAFDASLYAAPLSYAPFTTDRYAVVEQVLKGISVRNLGGINTSEVRLRLVPEHLGDVNVKLVVNNGQVNATVVASSADVRDTLVANQQHLARSLESAGLKLTGFSVDVSNGGFAGFQQQQPRGSAFSRNNDFASASDEAQHDDLMVAATPSFAPPQAVDPRIGQLNALV